MKRERHEVWSHFGFEQDVIVHSVGGETHYVEVRSIMDGHLILSKTFRGQRARQRAIEFASNYDESLGPQAPTQNPVEETDEWFRQWVENSTPWLNAGLGPIDPHRRRRQP